MKQHTEHTVELILPCITISLGSNSSQDVGVFFHKRWTENTFTVWSNLRSGFCQGAYLYFFSSITSFFFWPLQVEAFPFIKWISSWSSCELKLRALPSYTTISDHISSHQDSRPRNSCTCSVLSATSNHVACSPCKMLACNHGKNLHYQWAPPSHKG